MNTNNIPRPRSDSDQTKLSSLLFIVNFSVKGKDIFYIRIEIKIPSYRRIYR
jgi:hypothetical protein